ncbi:MAG TPA: hypoxanthine phosphoribosyltransferase [Planctomycetota bacterium]|nr:hypoxanthine phosphoribosyltransferase [Planctomycetota bacterium]HRR81585.1 hypoxanthine phosphoribosyltransferase [Planctomycetota bacterium]HRT94862.1 hypoxanthine phosphoribosyltransferase [Planctomycetota bacterium]
MSPGEVLFTADQIARRVAELAADIRRDGPDGPLTVLAILHGAAVFVNDLLRHLDGETTMELIEASSYGDGTMSSGRVVMNGFEPLDLKGRDVLIVDDIADTGRTLAAVRGAVEAAGPRSVRTCVLLDKPSRRRVEVAIDYCGFEVPDVFVVGYGLDHAGRYRDLPHIARLGEQGG